MLFALRTVTKKDAENLGYHLPFNIQLKGTTPTATITDQVVHEVLSIYKEWHQKKEAMGRALLEGLQSIQLLKDRGTLTEAVKQQILAKAEARRKELVKEMALLKVALDSFLKKHEIVGFRRALL